MRYDRCDSQNTGSFILGSDVENKTLKQLLGHNAGCNQHHCQHNKVTFSYAISLLAFMSNVVFRIYLTLVLKICISDGHIDDKIILKIRLKYVE